MTTHHHQPQSSKSTKKPWLIAAVLCAVIAVLVVVSKEGFLAKDTAANTPSAQQPYNKRSSNTGSVSENSTVPNADEIKPRANNTTENTARPTDTRASHRDTVTNAKGERKKVIDPIASWDNPPPWPEGGRLYAEVETSERKYVNLRPDEVGEMPRILAKAEEQIELRVNFPDATPGEKIYVEIPNGGIFPDSNMYGRTYDLPENRTLTFPYVTDDAPGYCTVMIRQGGHTRSLPIWVGKLETP